MSNQTQFPDLEHAEEEKRNVFDPDYPERVLARMEQAATIGAPNQVDVVVARSERCISSAGTNY